MALKKIQNSSPIAIARLTTVFKSAGMSRRRCPVP